MVDELTQIKHTEECLAYIWQTLNIVLVFVAVVEPFESLLLLLLSRSVMNNSLLPHWVYHTRLPFLSLSPVVCSISCPLSQWCHPTISSLSPPPPAYSTTGKDPAAGKDWGGEGDDREWDGWMASLTQWTWVVQITADSEGQESLMCYHPWDHK